MTPRKFFTERSVGFIVLLIIVLGVFSYKEYVAPAKDQEVSQIPTEENIENTEPPIFVWKYEKAQSLNLDGLPETDIFLEATYPNGGLERKLVDTTPGGCNDLPDADQDSVPNSANAQCYSAGLGYRYKITKGARTYLVMRKTFEEGLPDYTPPSYQYEVVAEFPPYK